MKVLCIAQVEDRTNLDAQILKQTVQPNRVIFHVDEQPAIGISARRVRISENHGRLQEVVKAYKPDLVWQVEGDCDLPEDCLERLLLHYDKLKDDDFGYVSGIQVGRHGIYCLGAWHNFTDDSFESIDYKLTGLQRVDATGFYCLLAPTDVWLSGKCEWTDEPWGPDVNWGLSIPGKKYVDMDLHIGHIVSRGVIRPDGISTCNVRFEKRDGKWKYKTHS
mgnify:CR=1 FL=1